MAPYTVIMQGIWNDNIDSYLGPILLAMHPAGQQTQQIHGMGNPDSR